MMRARIKTLEGARVKTIQFVDRNTIHGTQVYNSYNCVHFVRNMDLAYQKRFQLMQH